MISRIWHGWTEPGNADAYEALLKSEIFPGILAKKVAGFRRIELFRRPAGSEVEFVTVMWFDSLDAVKAFAGEDHETAYVPDKARAVLKRFDARSQHYEVREQRDTAADLRARGPWNG
jgi:antibiotic biosynthesis monooxygenase (ABM) superfamily enzyme